MTKYIIGEIFNSGRATLNKNPSDQTVLPNDASIIFPYQTCMPSLASPRLLSQSLDLVLAEKKVLGTMYIH